MWAGRLRLGRQPGEKIAVRNFKQQFEIGELGIAQAMDFGVGEGAEQKVELTHAPMPSAKADAFSPGIEPWIF